jgi:hypothetical protein
MQRLRPGRGMTLHQPSRLCGSALRHLVPSATWSRRSRQLIANKSMRPSVVCFGPSVVISYSSADAEPILLMVEKANFGEVFSYSASRLGKCRSPPNRRELLTPDNFGVLLRCRCRSTGAGQSNPLASDLVPAPCTRADSDRCQRTKGSATDSRGM